MWCTKKLMSSQLFAKNSDGDQGERKQEQSKHAETERRACLARDRRDRRGSYDEPHDGEVATLERRGSTRTVERRGADGCGWVVVVGHRTPAAMMLALARTPAKLRSRPKPPALPPPKLKPALTASSTMIRPVPIALLPPRALIIGACGMGRLDPAAER